MANNPDTTASDNSFAELSSEYNSKHTVGERLDWRIAHCRKQLEELCIIKAKAEAMQILNFPMEFIGKIF